MNETDNKENTQPPVENGEAKPAENPAGIEGVDFAPGKDIKKPSAEEELKKNLEAAKKEIEELKEGWSRERAEFLNYKKRSAQDMAKNRVYMIAKFVGSLLPVIDNLDRVLLTPSEDPALKSFISGVEMIRADFLSVLEKENIKAVNPANDPFDPFSMEAIALEERENLQTDTVIEVYQSGYILEYGEGERQVIRPARVRVGKPISAGKSA